MVANSSEKHLDYITAGQTNFKKKSIKQKVLTPQPNSTQIPVEESLTSPR